MTPQEKDKLDMQARLHQMKINTRLTALQAAQTLMGTHGYTGAVDHITLLAIATDTEKYILGEIETETAAAIENAGKPPSKIIPVRN